jgi:hypothetical protein
MPRSRSLSELVEANRSVGPVDAAQARQASTSFASSQVQAKAPGGGSGGSGQGKEMMAAAVDALDDGGTAGVAAKAAGAASKVGGILKIIAAFCWVAAEYYPRGSADWFRCRNWVLEHPRLTRWYAKNGESFAGFLRTHPTCHKLFRPVVLWAHRKGKV